MKAKELTRVYQYGLLAPTVNEGMVHDQVRHAWEYRRELTLMARARREVERGLELRAGLHDEREALEAAGAEMSAARLAIKEWKKINRSRGVPVELAERAKKAKETRTTARKKLAESRQRVRKLIQPERDLLHERWLEARRRLRASYTARGLRHGAYTEIENSLEQACSGLLLWDGTEPQDPRWPRWDGAGRLGEQIAGGIELDSLTTGMRVRVLEKGSRTPQDPDNEHDRRNGRDWPRYGELMVRVGSDESRGPIWAHWPIKLHRPFPKGGCIKRVMVSRRFEGPRERWTVEFTVVGGIVPGGDTTEIARRGRVAVDVGWRRTEDGASRLRVAAWLDEHGNCGVVSLDDKVITGIRRVETLRANRDEYLNAFRTKFCDWLVKQIEVPAWVCRMTAKKDREVSILQAASRLAQWRSQARWRSLCERWVRQRWDGDDFGFEMIAEWEKYDRHLWEWEAGQRAKSLRRRREIYRIWAAWLTRRYDEVVMEKFDKRGVRQRPRPEETETQQSERARSWAQVASVSQLENCLTSAAQKRGCVVTKINPAYTTQECPVCGKVDAWDAAASVMRRPPCPGCGAVWDQDFGAARVLMLRAGRERSGGDKKVGGAREPEKHNETEQGQETRWQRVARLRGEKEERMEAARKMACK